MAVNGRGTRLRAGACRGARGKDARPRIIDERGLGETVDLAAAYAEGRMRSPISHPDPAHLHITGTGLTHLGSAATRDSMHKKLTADGEENLTDSMKMFRMGLEGGKPAAARSACSRNGSTRATAISPWRRASR